MAGQDDRSTLLSLAVIQRAYPTFTNAYIAANPALGALISQVLNRTTTATTGTQSVGSRQIPKGVVSANPTLGDFTDALQSSQWKHVLDANAGVDTAAQQVAANANVQGINQQTSKPGTPGVTPGTRIPGQGTASANDPFSNLSVRSTWATNPAAFAAAKVYTSAKDYAVPTSTTYAPGQGPHGKPLNGSDRGQLIVNSSTPGQISAGSYMEGWLNASKGEVQNLQRALIGLGLLSPSYLTTASYGIFDSNTQDDLRQVLANVSQYNDPNVTIEAYLARGLTAAKVMGKDTSISRTTTSYTSQIDAEGAFQKVAQNLLGRGASSQEAAAGAAALHSAEVANPSRSTETQVVSPDNTIKSDTTVSTGGVGGLSGSGAQNILEQQARQSPDYAPYQAATTYFSALMNVMGALNSAGS